MGSYLRSEIMVKLFSPPPCQLLNWVWLRLTLTSPGFLLLVSPSKSLISGCRSGLIESSCALSAVVRVKKMKNKIFFIQASESVNRIIFYNVVKGVAFNGYSACTLNKVNELSGT